LAVAHLSKAINFSLSITAGNPVAGKIGFRLVAKAKIKNWKVNKLVLIHVYQTLFKNKK